MKYSDFEKQLGDKLRSHEADLDTSAFYKELMKGKKRKKGFAVIYRLPLLLLGLISLALLISNFTSDDQLNSDISSNEIQSSTNQQAQVKLASSANGIEDYDTILKHNDIPAEQNNAQITNRTFLTDQNQQITSKNKISASTNNKNQDSNKALNSAQIPIKTSNNISEAELTTNQTNNISQTNNYSTSSSKTSSNQTNFSQPNNYSLATSTKSNNIGGLKSINTLQERSTLNFEALNILLANQIITTPLIPSIKDVECPDFRINKGRMTIEILADAGYFYPMKSFIDGSSEVNEVNSLRNAHESSKEGWHAGIYAKFRNTKWPIYIQAGISEHFLTERMSLQYEYTRRDTTQGIISITTSENGDTITAIIGDIVTETEVSGKKVKHYKLQTLDIPVTIGYSIGFDKFTVDLEGGVLLNVSMNSTGSILTSQSDFDDISNQDPFKSKLGLSYLGGVSLGYHITPRSKVYINSKMRIIPGEINSHNNSLSQKYNFLGLNVGYGYTF